MGGVIIFVVPELGIVSEEYYTLCPMNKNELCETISRSTKKTTTQVQTVVSVFMDLIQQSVISGKKVTLQGFGTFSTKKRSARTGRTFDGVEINIPAAEVPIFRPSNGLKAEVRNRDLSAYFLKFWDSYKKITGKLTRIYRKGKIIGEYDFSDEEFLVMIALLNVAIKEKDITLFGDRFAFSTLLEISKRWKNDENNKNGRTAFMPFVTTILTGQTHKHQYIYRIVTEFVNQMIRKGIVSEASYSQKKYYATLMMHALAPRDSIYSLFNLCYNVFKEDLGFKYDTKNNGWIVEMVAEELRKSFSKVGGDENKAVQIGSNIYFIQIGLKSFALHDDMHKEFEQILHKVFSTINQLFYNDSFMPNKRSRIEKLLLNWWNETISGSKVLSSSESSCNTVVGQSKVYAKYILSRKRNGVQLYIPPILLDSIEDQIVITTYVDGAALLPIEMHTRKGEMFVETTEMMSDLNGLLVNSSKSQIDLRVVVKLNGKQIYDSIDKLKREFILFDDSNEIKTPVALSSNYTLYSRDIDSFGEYADKIHTIGNNLYNIYPNVGDILSSGLQKVFFIDKTNDTARGVNNIILIGNKNDAVWRSPSGESFKVFSSNINLLVSKTFNPHSLEIRCDGNRQNLSRVGFEVLNDGSKIYNLLKTGIVINGKPSQIEVYSYEKQKALLVESVYVLQGLKIQYNKQLYYGDMFVKTIVSCGDQDNTIEWINISKEMTMPYAEGILSFFVPRLEWRINNGEWNCRELKNISWFKDVIRDGDYLEVQAPNRITEIYLKTSDGKKHSVRMSDQNLYPIGRDIYAREKEKCISVYASVQLNSDSKLDFPLFHLATTEYFKEDPVSEIKGSYFWRIENQFVGSAGSSFKLVVKKNGNTLKAINLPLVDKVLDELTSCFQDFGDYLLTVEKRDGKSIFGGFQVIWQKKVTVDHPETIRFKGKKLHLSEARLSGMATFVRLGPQYDVRHLKFDESLSDDLTKKYTGQLFEDGKEVLWMFDEHWNKEEINPVIIEFRNNTSAFITPKSEEAFYYNKWEKRIANRPDDKKTKYDNKLRKSIYFEDNSHYHFIEFFKFVEEDV